jgi:hypothetical protein
MKTAPRGPRRIRNTIPEAARRIPCSEGQLRRAIARGEVRTVPFGGLERVTDEEIERVQALLGIEASR